MRGVGLMCGTSLDGIDAALVDIEAHASGDGVRVALVRAHTYALDASLAAAFRAALPPSEPGPREAAQLDGAFGDAFGRAAHELLDGERADFVACHGVTLYHDGARGISVQLGDPYRIRERVNVPVVSDFRRADCAAGGQGAPLVPYVDALLFSDDAGETVALNLGGIANLTIVPRRGSGAAVRAWDTGPGNMLIDALVTQRTAGRERYDADGAYALRGTVDAALLETLLDDPYFAAAPPKSTGREYFGQTYLARSGVAERSLEDGCATLAALTAQSIARDVRRFAQPGARIIASGGGIRNRAVLQALRAALPAHALQTSDAHGVDPDAKEAIAFAVLGFETLRGRACGLPSVTGARHAAILGSIAPASSQMHASGAAKGAA